MLRTWADSSLGIRVCDEKEPFKYELLSLEYIWSTKSYQSTSAYEENHNKKTWENPHQNPQIKTAPRRTTLQDLQADTERLQTEQLGAPVLSYDFAITDKNTVGMPGVRCDTVFTVWKGWNWDKLGRFRQKNQEATSCRLEKFPEGRWHQGYGWMGPTGTLILDAHDFIVDV